MANNERRPKLDDAAIIQMCQYGIGQSVGFSESKLSKERTRVLEYFQGERPRKAHDADSGYMSLDIYDAVEDMKAQLLDAFATGKRPVEFDPTGPGDEAAAKIRTDYVTNVIFSQNRGYKLFQDVIDQGLLARAGVVKVWWEKCEKPEFFELSQTTYEELHQWLVEHPDAEVVEKDTDEDGTVFKRVRLKVKKDVSQVRLKLLEHRSLKLTRL
jgi:hypothetical protein